MEGRTAAEERGQREKTVHRKVQVIFEVNTFARQKYQHNLIYLKLAK